MTSEQEVFLSLATDTRKCASGYLVDRCSWAFPPDELFWLDDGYGHEDVALILESLAYDNTDGPQ